VTKQSHTGNGRRKCNSETLECRVARTSATIATGNHTPVAGKGQKPAIDSQDIRYQETEILGGNT